jgi:hypothetical protein
MNIDLRFPNITSTTAEGQMAEMQSYMHQLVQQLNWALNTIDDARAGNNSSVVINNGGGISAEEAEDTFNSIKSLIIKSADIVKAYETTLKENFDGEYVAVSDFGTYKQDTNLSIETNSKNINEAFTNIQVIGDDIRETNAYIKRGYLGDVEGKPVYGIGVGETDANGSYKKYAWFTADKLSFFDGGGYEVAFISSNTLYITDAVFIGKVQFGGYKADTTCGLAFTWVGR